MPIRWVFFEIKMNISGTEVSTLKQSLRSTEIMTGLREVST